MSGISAALLVALALCAGYLLGWMRGKDVGWMAAKYPESITLPPPGPPAHWPDAIKPGCRCATCAPTTDAARIMAESIASVPLRVYTSQDATIDPVGPEGSMPFTLQGLREAAQRYATQEAAQGAKEVIPRRHPDLWPHEADGRTAAREGSTLAIGGMEFPDAYAKGSPTP